MTSPQIPHLRIVVAVSAFVLVGFTGVSAYVIGWSTDLVTKGNIIGTWQNFALLAVGFWLGSSSGGKSKEDLPSPKDAKEAASAVADAAADAAGQIERRP